MPRGNFNDGPIDYHSKPQAISLLYELANRISSGPRLKIRKPLGGKMPVAFLRAIGVMRRRRKCHRKNP